MVICYSSNWKLIYRYQVQKITNIKTPNNANKLFLLSLKEDGRQKRMIGKTFVILWQKSK